VNDNGPVFDMGSYDFSVVEGSPLRSTVGNFEVSDADINAAGRLSVSLSGSYSER